MRRFVVLEHRWNGVHWDFMLEAEGHLRTWAIDAPIVAGRRAARASACRTIDWPISTYEGPISGGRGSVSARIDRGRSDAWSGRRTASGWSSPAVSSSARLIL